jgi:hypothetical protein
MQTNPQTNPQTKSQMISGSKLKMLLAYIIAVLLAAALSSIVQSQFNLWAIAALVQQLTIEDWMATVWFDLRSFTPTMLVIMAPTLLLVLLASRLVHAVTGLNYFWLGVISSALGLLLALSVINALAPMPTLIAASRSITGSIALALCAALGAAIYMLLTRSKEA